MIEFQDKAIPIKVTPLPPFMPGLSSSFLKVQYKNASYSSEELLPGVWRRVCVSRDPQAHRIYVRDRRSFSPMDGSQSAPVEGPRGICLGSSSPGHKSFSGVITAFSIQPWSVGPQQDSQIEPTDCSALEPPNALLTLSSSWVQSGSVRIVNYDAAQFCAEAFTILSLKYLIGRRPQLHACKNLGGRFPTAGEVESTPAYYTQALKSSCITNGKFASWMYMETSQVKLQSLCLVLLKNGSLSNHTCISELQCFLCLVPVALRYTVIGGIRAHDATYVLQATADRDLHLVGETSEIVREGDKWVLQSQLHSESWYLKGAVLPVGRHKWHFHDERERLNVTVTSCDAQGEFVCSAGDCIPRKRRCDGIKHCFDGSDERRCDVLKMTEAYDKFTSPCSGKMKCTMMYGIFVHFISDITTQDGQASLDITLRLAWYDHRLQFNNPRKIEQEFDCDEIWRPSLIAMAGQAEGQISKLVLYSATCGVNRNETDGHRYDPRDPMMSKDE
ncbi:uncharacterized protein [Panulirus ornatus]|uniref:uncharacterized protein n=1 Tax=Panulirus ornatus TaxID=150431 RepID=UPI003A87795C